MRRPRHEIEAEVPRRGRPGRPGEPGSTSLPQIRRQVERICEAIDVPFEDVIELHINTHWVEVTQFDRKDGELYRNEFDDVATRHQRIPVDLTTFLGDERDR